MSFTHTGLEQLMHPEYLSMSPAIISDACSSLNMCTHSPSLIATAVSKLDVATDEKWFNLCGHLRSAHAMEDTVMGVLWRARVRRA